MKQFILIFFISSSFAIELDKTLSQYVQTFKFAPVEKLKIDRPALYRLGKKLFFDKRLSLTEKISCSTCHDPNYGSSDALPFSIGVNDNGIGTERIQINGKLTRRTSPVIINKGHADFDKMFWDGRVFYSRATKRFYTPEKGLNGTNPKYTHITSVLESALAAQALFPMTSSVEMKGAENEHLSNIEVWNKIEKRILGVDEYKVLIKRAFKIDKVNIAHLANAIAYFEGRFFQATNTPWDKYLRGDKKALSDDEKRGAIIFSTKARCARCHHGKHLTNFAFQNIAVPQIYNNDHSKPDRGRYEIVPQDFTQFGFLTQPLRNISKTSPYFHNGAFKSLSEVIEHYSNAKESLYFYNVQSLNKLFSKNYLHQFSVDLSPKTLSEMERKLHPLLRRSFKLTEKEKKYLLKFLEVSLTEN